jgi:hypothetical protein
MSERLTAYLDLLLRHELPGQIEILTPSGHNLHMLRGIDSTQTCEHVKIILTKPDAIVFEMARTSVSLVSAENTILTGDSHHPIDHLETFDFACIQ